MTCIPAGVSSLKGGQVSMVFHVPFEESDAAFKVHDLQGSRVRVEIYREDS